MRLKNILIVVTDIERSKAFYKELFGLEVVVDFDGNVILTEGLFCRIKLYGKNFLTDKLFMAEMMRNCILSKMIWTHF